MGKQFKVKLNTQNLNLHWSLNDQNRTSSNLVWTRTLNTGGECPSQDFFDFFLRACTNIFKGLPLFFFQQCSSTYVAAPVQTLRIDALH